MAENVVEIGFDVSGSPLAPFVTLNDPVKGLLASEAAPSPFVLGGTLFYDVTDKVLGYGVTRGKNRQLDRYSAGQVTVNLDNTDRTFDPLYSDSEYAGQIIPRRPIRVTSNGIRQIVGSIDDWDLAYEAKGRSVATAKGSDGLTQLANQTVTSGTQAIELSGTRINKILSDTEVNWPVSRRTIDAGRTTLQADTIGTNVNALTYVQRITEIEPGAFYVAKNGNARFRDRYSSASNGGIVFSDSGTDIPYTNLRVVYGTELLANEVIVERRGGGTATAFDADSQEQYGIFNLTVTDALMNEDVTAGFLADLLSAKYSQPEYRFEALEVDLSTVGTAIQNDILGLELGDVVQVTFTPSGIGDAINRNVEVIRIAQRVTPTSHTIEFGFGALEVNFWRLSDDVFGRLSAGNSLAY
jgi:hypothetical protein